MVRGGGLLYQCCYEVVIQILLRSVNLDVVARCCYGCYYHVLLYVLLQIATISIVIK